MIKLKKLLPMIVVATIIGGIMTGCSNSGSNNADKKNLKLRMNQRVKAIATY